MEGRTAVMTLKRMHELLFEMSNDGIVLHEVVTTSARGHFMAANDAVCRLLGYTAEEMSQLTPIDIMSPEAILRVPREAEEFRVNATLLHDKQLVAKDGRSIRVEISSRRLRDRVRKVLDSR
jgi:PAS domain S-box-containing protein